MESILRKTVERVSMAIVFFIGVAIFFLLYTEKVEQEYLKRLCSEFVYDISKDGVLTESEYYMFLDSIAELDTGFNVELSHTEYEENPFYSYYSEEEISSYFAARNILQEVDIPIVLLEHPEIDPEGLVSENKTNAEVLS